MSYSGAHLSPPPGSQQGTFTPAPPIHPAFPQPHHTGLPPYLGLPQQQQQQQQQLQHYGQYPTPGLQNPPYNAVISSSNHHQQHMHMQQQLQQQYPSGNIPPPTVFNPYQQQQQQHPYYPSYPPSVDNHHHHHHHHHHHQQQQQLQPQYQQPQYQQQYQQPPQQFYPPPQQQQQQLASQNQIQQHHPPPLSNYPFTISPHQFPSIPPPVPPPTNIIHQQLLPPLPTNSTMPPPPPTPPFAVAIPVPTPTSTMQPTIITAQPIFIRPPLTNTSFSAPPQPRVFTHTPVQVDLTKVTVGKMADIAKVSLSRQNNEVVGVVSSNSISKNQPSSYSTIDTINILPSHIPHIEPGRLDVRIHDFYSKYNELVAKREGNLSLTAAGNY